MGLLRPPSERLSSDAPAEEILKTQRSAPREGGSIAENTSLRGPDHDVSRHPILFKCNPRALFLSDPRASRYSKVR